MLSSLSSVSSQSLNILARGVATTCGILVNEFGPPEVMKMATAMELPTLQLNQVLIEVSACGVNPSDTYIRAGTYRNLPSLPYTPGKDCAGVVLATGGDVSDFRTGDRVFTLGSVTGTYARHTICEASQVYRLPQNVSFAEGACIGVPTFTAYRALFIRGNLQPGDAVFIHGGTGGVGMSAIQLAKDAGCYVVASGGSEEGMEVLRQLGCDEVVCHREEGYLERVMEVRPEGFDVCLEMLANVNLDKDLQIMARHGRIMVIGSRGEVTINPRDCMVKEVDVRGVFLFQSTPEEKWRMSEYIHAKLSSEALLSHVGKRLALEQAPEAHHDVINRPEGLIGNIVMIPPGSEEPIEEPKLLG